MKSEERHELKENDLAGWMYRLPIFLKDYGSFLLFAVALAILAYQLYGWYEGQKTRKLEEAQSELAEASGSFLAGRPANPVKLRDLIGKYDDHRIQAQAYTALGDFYTDFINLGSAPTGVKITLTPEQASQEALTAYNKVLSDYSDEPLCVVRAHLGLGRIYEDRGEWAKARAEYEIITTKTSGAVDAAFVTAAQHRIDQLATWQKPIAFGPPAPPAPPTATAPATAPALAPFGPTLPN